MYYFISKNDVIQEVPDCEVAAFSSHRYFKGIDAAQWWYVNHKDLRKFRRLVKVDRSVIPKTGEIWRN